MSDGVLCFEEAGEDINLYLIYRAGENPRFAERGRAYDEHCKVCGPCRGLVEALEEEAGEDLFKNSEVKALCGGGLFTLKDIKTALEVGCDGVALDSVIAKVKKPERFLKGLALLG
ncbi:hypothetical protein CMI48_03860 [Candidatus Pacearchaeota archaeon]|nr:hypothetical protein [Candidatus Pacearchaeota archaeon]